MIFNNILKDFKISDSVKKYLGSGAGSGAGSGTGSGFRFLSGSGFNEYGSETLHSSVLSTHSPQFTGLKL